MSTMGNNRARAKKLREPRVKNPVRTGNDADGERVKGVQIYRPFGEYIPIQAE